MTAEEKNNPSQKRPILLTHLLVILGALLLFGFTLDHWVTLNSLPIIAKVTGWDWHPFSLPWRQTQVAPLFFLLTCPLRLLPVAWQPVALNAFAAICAALTLGILAASVRLLPHDRTREQRQREGGEFSLLSLPTALLPVLFAVLMMGLQLTFWRNAISATGEMLDLLVFAFLIFCLLKFRISQNDNWLSSFAFVYGLGTANNWALIGFFPFFLIAMVWIKGVNFFNGRFLGRVTGCGLSGLLLYLLIPTISSLGGGGPGFKSLLSMEMGAQSFGLHLIPRWIVLVAALPTLLPLVFAGIKWPSFEGELSAAGSVLTKFMFRLLHVFFLLLAISMFFEFKRSPSQALKDMPIGFLTFFYLGALGIGYFSGYVLLVYGKSAAPAWEKRGPVTRAFNLMIVGLLWLLAVAAPCRLLYENIPHINAGKNHALADFAGETIRDLPAQPVVILCDDPVRLYLLEAAFSREGKPNKNILIETPSLPHREYLAYLISRYPALKSVTTPPEKLTRTLGAESLIGYLYHLTQKGFSIYYVQPSFGYYFEVFYLKPHGLVYELQHYARDVIEPPLPTAQEIKENQDIWAKLQKKSLDSLPPMAKLSPDAAAVAGYCSVALNYWGVALQKAGHLPEANADFKEAAALNPQNFIAKINREYNERLQKNDHRPIETGDLIFKALNVYRGIMPILKFNGPVDEPGLNLDFGRMMAEGRNFRQAAILFERCLQLLPGNISAQLDLAKTFVDWNQPDKAIELVQKLRANPKANNWEVSRVEALAYYAKKDFPSAERLMQNALKEDPKDANRVAILAEFYRVTGYAALREKNKKEAARRFNNSLIYIGQQLQLLAQPGNKSTNPYNVPDTLLKKAEVEMMLKGFEAGIATLNQVMELQPDNRTALLNRAIAEVQIHQIPAAKSDYKTLRKLLPQQPYVIDFGLADIAAREQNPAEEIHYLKRYLESAPDDSAEYQQVKLRVKKLESH